MGVCLQNIKGNGPTLDTKDMNINKGFIWVCVRRDPVIKKGKTAADWHIQGVASDEDTAVEMCRDQYYGIGPLPLDTALPHELFEWKGFYYPLGDNPKTPSKEE